MKMDSVLAIAADTAASGTSEPSKLSTEKCADMSLEANLERGELLKKKKRITFQNARSSLHIIEDRSKKKYRNSDIANRIRRPRREWSVEPKTCNAQTCTTIKSSRSPGRSSATRSASPSYVTRPRAICSRAYTSASMQNNRRILRCPLRIAELATPTKRHCIETWRDRNHVLPSHMLERLKQNVMNQKVIATIPDAVDCFKVHRNAAASHRYRSDNRCRNARKSKRQSQEMADIRLMSAVFAHRVAAQLVKPIQIYLSEDLQKLGNIVGDEIAKLIQNRRICADYVYNRSLLKEMSGKVTVWISDILASAQYKLLEDELRVIKTKENKMGKDGDLVTLIDQYVRWQMEDSPDLEEEEGPALDALDVLVDNVMDICLPKSDSSTFDYESPSGENDYPTLPARESKISEDDEEQQFYEGGNSKQSDQTTPTDTINDNNMRDITGVYDIPERNEKQDYSDDDSDSKYGSTAELDSNPSNEGIKNVADEEENKNVSVTLEEPLDDRKKVKFSLNGEDTNGAGGGTEPGTGAGARVGSGARRRGGAESGSYAGTGADAGGTGTEGRPWTAGADAEGGAGNRVWAGAGARIGTGTGDNGPKRIISNESLGKYPKYSLSATLIKSDIVFQPPNPSILSVVDESWPDDYLNPTLKPSSSVSKSITSLGEIKEVDESDLRDERRNLSTHVLKNNIITKESLNVAVHDIQILRDNMRKLSSNSIKKDKNNLTQDQIPKSFKKIPASKLLSDLQALIVEQAEQIREKQINEQNFIADDENFKEGKGDYNDIQKANLDDTDTERNPIIQAIKEKMKNDAKPKFDYRVRPQTAPAWAITSPSDESMPAKRKKTHLGSAEIRKWCKDIEHTLTNLEQWNNWLDITCKKILYLQEKTEPMKRYPPQYRLRLYKEWMKLKKSIDKDAILWRKLNQRTFEVLKTYPSRSKLTNRAKTSAGIQRTVDKEYLLNAIAAIEGLSSRLHRSVVSTEHSVRCNCQTLMAKPQYALKLRKNYDDK